MSCMPRLGWIGLGIGLGRWLVVGVGLGAEVVLGEEVGAWEPLWEEVGEAAAAVGPSSFCCF